MWAIVGIIVPLLVAVVVAVVISIAGLTPPEFFYQSVLSDPVPVTKALIISVVITTVQSRFP
ncbi:MAG: hypothetical protein WAW61_20650 [Methylococcaceae bacterium]